jgi:hypothetical protein
LVTRNDYEPGAQRTKVTRIKARRTDECQRCDSLRVRLREAGNIRQHRGREVGALNPQMIEHLRKTVGHTNICCCCHPLTFFILSIQ